MKIVLAHIDEVCSIYGREYPKVHKKGLVTKMKKSGWEGIDPMPAIELPWQIDEGIRYSYYDGNHRYGSALISELKEVLLLVFRPEDDINEVSKRSGNAVLPSYETHLSYAMANNQTL